MIFIEDIHRKIREDFLLDEVEEVELVLKQTIDMGLNVGANQFARSVIFLADKNKEALKRILSTFDDPRDVVAEAENKSGNLDHWFAISFDEIEKLNGKKYSGEIFKQNQAKDDDGLPF